MQSTKPNPKTDSPEPILPSLMTAEGALSFVEWCKAQMREEFLREGEYPSPDGYVFATCDPGPIPAPGQKITVGAKLPEPIPVRVPVRAGTVMSAAICKLHGKDEREVFAVGTRLMAKGTNAVGVVVMMEMWYLLSEGVTPPPEGRWFKGPVSEQPDRREGLFISLEHKVAGTRTWYADIERDPLRLGDWYERPVDRTEGRLTHLAGHES